MKKTVITLLFAALFLPLAAQNDPTKDADNRIHDASFPHTPMDLEQCGFRVNAIQAHPYTASCDRLKKWGKKEARRMRKQGWKSLDSHIAMEDLLERVFCAFEDENVVVLENMVKAADLEQGWHNAYSLAVFEYLGRDTLLNSFTEWFKGNYESYIQALGDKYTVMETFDYGVYAYKYDSEGLTYIFISKPSEEDDSTAVSLMDMNFFRAWDFESVEKVKRVVASGDSITLYRKVKDRETGQTTYEIKTCFIVKAPSMVH